MILSYEQIKTIGFEVEQQRGQAIIREQEGAEDIGFQVNVNPHTSRPLFVTVEVSGGKTVHVRVDGKVEVKF